MRYALVLILALAMALAACSGGDDDEPSDPNTTPAPNANAVTGNEEALASLEVDEDGNIDFATPIPPGEENTGPTAAVVPPDFQAMGELDDPEVILGVTAAPIIGMGEGTPGQTSIPLPGTLEANRTPELEPIGDFTYLSLVQEGGPRDISSMIEIYSDGRVVVDGQSGTVGPQDIQQLQALIDELNYFGMQGMFRGQVPLNEEEYSYRIYVESGDYGRAVNAQDKLMPSELITFVRTIMETGRVAVQAS